MLRLSILCEVVWYRLVRVSSTVPKVAIAHAIAVTIGWNFDNDGLLSFQVVLRDI